MAGRAGGERDLHGARDAGTGDDPDGRGADRVGDSSGPAGHWSRRRRTPTTPGAGARRPAGGGAGLGHLGARPAGDERASGCGAPYVLFTGSSRPGWRSSSARPRPARGPQARRRRRRGQRRRARREATRSSRCRSTARSRRSSMDGEVENLFDETDAPIALAPEPRRRPRRRPRRPPRRRVRARARTDHRHRAARAGVQGGQAHGRVERRAATIRRNRTMTLKLEVANDGSKRSSKVTISVGKARGLSVRRVARSRRSSPRRSGRIKLRVKLSARPRPPRTSRSRPAPAS